MKNLFIQFKNIYLDSHFVQDDDIKIYRSYNKSLIHEVFYNLCERGDIEQIKKISESPYLKYKINIEMVDTSQSTPLLAACKKGHLNVVDYLVTQLKANIFHKNNSKNNAFMEAVEYGHMEIVQYFIINQNLSIDKDTMVWLENHSDKNTYSKETLSLIQSKDIYHSLQETLPTKVEIKKKVKKV